MHRTAALNKLFDDWKNSVPEGAPFIRDGIICEDRWNNARTRIVFLLKEVNKFKRPQYRYDFRTYCCNEPWPLLGKWACGLQQIDTAPSFSSLSKEQWKEAFRSTAIMNLRKTIGGPNTNWRNIRQHVSHPYQKDQLRKQLDILEPNLVLCGGATKSDSVFTIAKDILLCGPVRGPYQSPIFNSDARVTVSFYYEAEKCRVWIDYVHPSSEYCLGWLEYQL